MTAEEKREKMTVTHVSLTDEMRRRLERLRLKMSRAERASKSRAIRMAISAGLDSLEGK